MLLGNAARYRAETAAADRQVDRAPDRQARVVESRVDRGRAVRRHLGGRLHLSEARTIGHASAGVHGHAGRGLIAAPAGDRITIVDADTRDDRAVGVGRGNQARVQVLAQSAVTRVREHIATGEVRNAVEAALVRGVAQVGIGAGLAKRALVAQQRGRTLAVGRREGGRRHASTRLAGVARRAHVPVVAWRPVGLVAARAGPRRRVAGARKLALATGAAAANNRRARRAGAALAAVVRGAGIVVCVAGRPVGSGRVRAGAR